MRTPNKLLILLMLLIAPAMRADDIVWTYSGVRPLFERSTT